MKYVPSGTSKAGKPYPHKVELVEVAGVKASISDGWKCDGVGIALSGAVSTAQWADLSAAITAALPEGIALLQSAARPMGFTPDSSGAFVPSSPAALQDDRLIGAAVGTTGDLPGVGRIRVTTSEGHYEMA
jgi:hypothetical protein